MVKGVLLDHHIHLGRQMQKPLLGCAVIPASNLEPFLGTKDGYERHDDILWPTHVCCLVNITTLYAQRHICYDYAYFQNLITRLWCIQEVIKEETHLLVLSIEITAVIRMDGETRYCIVPYRLPTTDLMHSI